MRITFLIGNGFDMRMGIASSYKSVEAHYIGLNKSSKTLQEFQKALSYNGEYWSNFELGIGKYTAHFDVGDQQSFNACLEDFTTELGTYLQAEEEKVDFALCDKEIKEEFVRSIKNFDGELERSYREQLSNILATGDAVEFKFISFNYTHLLDKCLELSFDEKTVVGSHVRNSTRYNHIVNTKVIHIHGELPEPIITGVDNPSQIENEAWAKQSRFLQRIAKPSINARYGALVDNEASKAIKESHIICLFGMSMGDTDKTWWKLIGQWLSSPDHRLVIFAHKSDLVGKILTLPRRFILEDEFKDKFLDLAEISNTDRPVIENRIFVNINSSLFNVNLVELTTRIKATAEIENEAKVKEFTAELEKHQKILELASATSE